MIKKIWIITLLALWDWSAASANVIYVDCFSPNNPGSGTFDDPFRQIQTGIDAAINGDTVLIRPGVYSGTGNYGLDPAGKSITICSSDPNDQDIIARTIIDPEKQGRGFNIHSAEDANCIISGLTIRNSIALAGSNGAGIYCYYSSPVIRNCVIKNNRAVNGSGGGICFNYGNATVIDCTITANSAHYYGGGISSGFASPAIIGCTISGNSATFEGGGIDSGMSNPTIFNCIIIDNNSTLGGGINCYLSGVTNVVNCTITANSADNVGGGINCWSQADITIKNSILWANSAIDDSQLGLQEEGAASVAYCNVQGGQADVYDPCGLLLWGQGNIDNDPCFASFDPNGDPNLWDFHLQSKDGRWNSIFYRIDFNNDVIINLTDFAQLADKWLQQGELPEDLDYSGTIDWLDLEFFSQNYLTNDSADGWISDVFTSPCIDAGDPESEWSAEPWPNGKQINMGAFGGTNQASKSGNIADLNIDGIVNFIDFTQCARLWNEQAVGIEDLDNDGIINLSDVEIISANWLWEKQ